MNVADERDRSLDAAAKGLSLSSSDHVFFFLSSLHGKEVAHFATLAVCHFLPSFLGGSFAITIIIRIRGDCMQPTFLLEREKRKWSRFGEFQERI